MTRRFRCGDCHRWIVTDDTVDTFWCPTCGSDGPHGEPIPDTFTTTHEPRTFLRARRVWSRLVQRLKGTTR